MPVHGLAEEAARHLGGPRRFADVLQFLGDHGLLGDLGHEDPASALEARQERTRSLGVPLGRDEIIFLESKEVISMCSTGFFKKSFLLL